MSENKNYQSRHLIKTWYNRANLFDGSYDYFDRFICLWISFNCFFVSEFYKKAKKLSNNREPQEKKHYLNIIYTNKNYKKIYKSLIENDKLFKEDLNDFKKLTETITHFRGKIADMRQGRLKKKFAQPFKNIGNFKQFILCVYQIRCNLFHGNKSPVQDGDRELVEGIFKPFNKFLKEVYETEEYFDN